MNDFNEMLQKQLEAMIASKAYHSEISFTDKGYVLTVSIAKEKEEEEE